MRKFVDLSIYLENDVASDPPAFKPKIEYLTHATTTEQIAGLALFLASDTASNMQGTQLVSDGGWVAQ